MKRLLLVRVHYVFQLYRYIDKVDSIEMYGVSTVKTGERIMMGKLNSSGDQKKSYLIQSVE